MRKALVLAVVLSLVSYAVAGPTQITSIKNESDANASRNLNVVVENVGSFAAAGGAVKAFKVSFNAVNAGDKIVGVDVLFDSKCYQVGINFGTGFFTPDATSLTSPFPISAGGQQIDSHLLLPTAAFTPSLIAPTEQNNWAYKNVAFPGESEGLGQLQVRSAIASTYLAQNLDFAYIVVQSGQSAKLTGSVANANGQKYYFSSNGDINGTGGIMIPIPEPATMALIGTGLLGLIGRKRRS
jgi:hypothetical protein